MKNSFIEYVLHCILLLCFFTACNQGEETYVPKPRAFFRIELPEHSFQTLKGSYPYYFEYSKLAQVLPDTTFMSEPFWIELAYPDLSASIHISYKAIKNKDELLEDYINDSYTLASKHNIKAYAIDQVISTTDQGYTLVTYELEGDVPTQFQYYMTDSTKHFFRASMYFHTSQKNDSLAPVIKYIKEDMLHMIKTFSFNDTCASASHSLKIQ